MTLRARSCPRCHSIGDPRIVDRTLGSNEPIHCRDPWHVESAEPPRAGRFEELLAAEHEQFDHRSELLASVVEYQDAPSGTASAPRADPPDSPDLRTLAAEALYAAPDEECGTWHGIVRVVLAAVLPAHRRQVLDEAADRLDPGPRDHNRTEALMSPADWVKAAQRGAAANLRMWAWQDLASAAPETAPRPRRDDETAPEVGREAAEVQRTTEAAARVPLAEVLDALRDHDAFVEWTRSNGPSGYLADYVGRDDRDSCARYLAERFPTAPQGADERNDRG